MYPSILQYIDSLGGSGNLLNSLKQVRLVQNQNGDPIFSSGNFGVVFKVSVDGQFKALKCFTREQYGRKTAYAEICKYFNQSRLYTIKLEFFNNEIQVFYKDGTIHSFPVLIMDWIEGGTLSKAIHNAVMDNDCKRLRCLNYKFEAFSRWLLGQPFAHGDLKPDNIIVNNDLDFVLVDYDGICMPSMVGQDQREVGTFGFQHPLRPFIKLGKEIDHYSIAIIAVTLRALAQNPTLYLKFGNGVNLFDPTKLVVGQDACYNYLSKTNLGETDIFKALKSEKPIIDNIENMLYHKAQCDLVSTSVHNIDNTHSPKKSLIQLLNDDFNIKNGIIKGRRFDAVHNLVSEFSVVCSKRKWGVVDKNGNVVVPIIYDRVRNYSEGLFAVCLNNKWGYTAVGMKKPIAMKFDSAWSFRCSRGLVKRADKYGFIDQSGKIIIPIKFDYAQSFTENVACVKKDGKYGFINTSGQWIVKPIYDYAQSVVGGVAKVTLEQQSLIIEVKLSK